LTCRLQLRTYVEEDEGSDNTGYYKYSNEADLNKKASLSHNIKLIICHIARIGDSNTVIEGTYRRARIRESHNRKTDTQYSHDGRLVY